MSKEIERREVWAVRLKPATIQDISKLALSMKLGKAELIETAIARLQNDMPAARIKTIRAARACIRDADTDLERIERGEA